MKLLFIGDIVGAPGREALTWLLPGLRKERGIDVVVANGENAAGGSGINPAKAEEIFAAGVDVITCGDHLWDQREVIELLSLTRPKPGKSRSPRDIASPPPMPRGRPLPQLSSPTRLPAAHSVAPTDS